jgi:hypothetical protein
VGTAGVIAILVILVRWFRSDGIDLLPAVAIAAVAGASFPVLYSAGQFHIEGIAAALTLAGVWLASRKTTRAFVWAAAILCLACLAKQTQVVPAAGVLVWMLRESGRSRAPGLGRSDGVFALLVAGGVGVVSVIGLSSVFGVEVWRHLFTFTSGRYSGVNLAAQVAQHAVPWIPLAVVAFHPRSWPEGRSADVRWWYLVGMTAWLPAAARVGSGYQYFLEWQLAVLVCAARPLGWWWAAVSNGTPLPRVARALTAALLVANVGVAAMLGHLARNGMRDGLALRDICPMLPVAPELILTESAGAARACGASPATHPFIMADLSRRGLWDERPLLQAIRQGRYPVVLLPFDPSLPLAGVHRDRWTEEVVAAIHSGYAIAAVSGEWRLLQHRNVEARLMRSGAGWTPLEGVSAGR